MASAGAGGKPRSRRRRLRAALALVALGALAGVAAVAALVGSVDATSSESFCADRCHAMSWAKQSWERGPHFANAFGVRATCADCHIPGESRPATPFQYVFGTLWTKGLDGSEDVVARLRGALADEAEWKAAKPRLDAKVEAWFASTHSATCQGCHVLDAFASQGGGAAMAAQVHAGVIRGDRVDCLACHHGIAHADGPAS